MKFESRVPLRLSLAGGGTDVEPYASIFGSKVVNFTINKYICGKSSQVSDEKPRISIQINNLFEGSSQNKTNFESQLENVLKKKFEKYKNQNLKLNITSPVLAGSGLGASSAIIVCILDLIYKNFGETLSLNTLAQEAWNVERLDMRIKGGFQDHYSAAFGGFNIFTQERSMINSTSITLTKSFQEQLEDSLLLIDLKKKRSGENIIEDQERRVKNRDITTLTALHEQIAIVDSLVTSLNEEDLNSVAKLLNKAWQSKKDFSPMITSPEIDRVHDLLIQSGSLGVKISGAGGGGHMFALVPKESKFAIVNKLESIGLTTSDIKLEKKGCTTWMN